MHQPHHGESLASSDSRGPVRRVIIIELALNLILAGSKITIGLLARNLTVLSDGFHGVIDASNNIVGLAGMHFSHLPPDRNHPYGHRKIEALLALGIGAVMALTSWEIGRAILGRWLSGDAAQPAPADPLFITLLGLTMIANALIAAYEARMGARYQSAFLIADSTHTKTHVAMDGLAIGSLALAGWLPWIDSLLAVIVVGYLLRSGWHIVRDNTMILTDAARLDPAEVREVVEGVEGVGNCHAVRSHGMPDEIYLDLHVVVDPGMTAVRAQAIEENVRRALFAEFRYVKEVSIHHQTQPTVSESPHPVRRPDAGEA